MSYRITIRITPPDFYNDLFCNKTPALSLISRNILSFIKNQDLHAKVIQIQTVKYKNDPFIKGKKSSEHAYVTLEYLEHAELTSSSFAYTRRNGILTYPLQAINSLTKTSDEWIISHHFDKKDPRLNSVCSITTTVLPPGGTYEGYINELDDVEEEDIDDGVVDEYTLGRIELNIRDAYYDFINDYKLTIEDRINYVMLFEGLQKGVTSYEGPEREKDGHILRYVLNDFVAMELCTYI
jgi:hypothetical protein